MKNNNSSFDRLESKVYCRVKPSKIHGVGVFAIKDIPLGVCPFSFPNHHNKGETLRLSVPELNKLDDDVREMLLDYNLLCKKGLFVHPKELEVFHIGQFLNGSKDPNIKLDPNLASVFKTIKEIKKGEELTVDYNKDLEGSGFVYNCTY